MPGVVANLLGAAAKAQLRGALADQLQTALDSRAVIERARGALMERERLDDQEAFTHLRRAARSSGRPRWLPRSPPASPCPADGPGRRRPSRSRAMARLTQPKRTPGAVWWSTPLDHPDDPSRSVWTDSASNVSRWIRLEPTRPTQSTRLRIWCLFNRGARRSFSQSFHQAQPARRERTRRTVQLTSARTAPERTPQTTMNRLVTARSQVRGLPAHPNAQVNSLAWSSLGLAVQASGVWAGLPGDGASAASGRQPEAARVAAQPFGQSPELVIGLVGGGGWSAYSDGGRSLFV
jgi:ANTAR domain